MTIATKNPRSKSTQPIAPISTRRRPPSPSIPTASGVSRRAARAPALPVPLAPLARVFPIVPLVRPENVSPADVAEARAALEARNDLVGTWIDRERDELARTLAAAHLTAHRRGAVVMSMCPSIRLVMIRLECGGREEGARELGRATLGGYARVAEELASLEAPDGAERELLDRAIAEVAKALASARENAVRDVAA